MSARTIGLLTLAVLAPVAAHSASRAAQELMLEATAATPDAGHGRILYLKHCTGCHGQHAWGDAPKEVPALAGQRELYLLQELVQFATRDRENSLMHETLQSPDLNRPQAMRDLAAHLTRARRNPRPEHGEGRDLAAAERAYRQGCSGCHGINGEGSDTQPIPAIGGQHYPYILAQLQSFSSGHRGQVEPPVIDFSAGLTPAEQQAVADYVSRLAYLKER